MPCGRCCVWATRTLALVYFMAAMTALAAAARGAELQYITTAAGERLKPTVAVDKVCAWPNLTVMPDGAVVATIFGNPSHGQAEGDVECWATEDGGQTWHKRGTPAPHEPNKNRMNVSAGLANSGDLLVIASGWSNEYPVGKSGDPFRAGIERSWVCRSSDGGRSWSVDKEAFPATGPRGGDLIPFGDILPGKDGDLLTAVYEVLARRNDRVWIYRSSDDGQTWGSPAPLDEEAFRNETALLHLGEGRWLAAPRENGLHLHASDDDGRTWRHVDRIAEKGQHPAHLLRLADGRLLLTYGNRTGQHGVDVRLSSDEGQTWGEPRRLLDFDGDGGYPASVQLPDGQILSAYYARQIDGHDGYHMGVVRWTPPARP